jgi:hypothetical protein
MYGKLIVFGVILVASLVVVGCPPVNLEPPRGEVAATSTAHATLIPSDIPTEAINTPATTEVPTQTIEDTSPNPLIYDDFSTQAWDNSLWDLSTKTEYAERQDEVLYFSPPLNEGEFISHFVDAALPGDKIIEKVSFKIKVDTPPGPKRGDLGALIVCTEYQGLVGIFWGGPAEELRVVSRAVGGQEETIKFLPLVSRQENFVELTWVNEEIELRLNGEAEVATLPSYSDLCWINFTADLEMGEEVSGYIDDVSVIVSE